MRGDFLRSCGDADRTIVFLDPPYDVADLLTPLAVAAARLDPAGVVVLEHRKSTESPESAGPLRRVRVLKAGDSALSFYRYA
jgi:16S rRNA G966 N2-methylase RsmD